MGTTLLHRIFGLGKIPKRHAPVLRGEGMVLADEGIGGSATMRHFRAPGRRHSYKRSWFTGCVVLTEKTLAAFAFSRPLVYVPLTDPRLARLEIRAEDDTTLYIGFDVALFHDGWSGTVECRFNTPKAKLFVDRLTAIG